MEPGVIEPDVDKSPAIVADLAAAMDAETEVEPVPTDGGLEVVLEAFVNEELRIEVWVVIDVGLEALVRRLEDDERDLGLVVEVDEEEVPMDTGTTGALGLPDRLMLPPFERMLCQLPDLSP